MSSHFCATVKPLRVGVSFFMEQEIEIWKDCVGYDGKYRVSNFGRVLSFKRKNTIFLTRNLNREGYFTVGLSKNLKNKTTKVHRILAMAFIPNPLNLPTVNHIDFNRSNNHISNLEWASYADQKQHVIKHKGLIGGFVKGMYSARGSEHYHSKLTEEDVIEIRKMLDIGVSCTDLGKKYGVSGSNIASIKRRKIWRHI